MDYHDAFVQVCVMNAGGEVLANRRCVNSMRVIVEFVQRYSERVLAAIESCCGAAALADELIDAGWQVSLAHAGYVHKIKQSPDKTDWSDARLLADLLRIGYLPRVWLPPASLRQLRHVVRLRQQWAEAKRAAKLRVTALLRTHRVCFAGSRWTKSWIAAVRSCTQLGLQGQWVVGQLLDEIEHIQRCLKRTEDRLAEITAADPFVQKLLGSWGIGLVTATMLRAEIGTMDRFRNGKQLSRFCCLTPWNVSSGLKQADAGLIRAGNPQLRAILIEAAHRLQRCDRRWMEFGLQLKRRGKPSSLVAAAVANRWIRWLHHELRGLQVV
jgi:transposase